jgi:HEAT repeat protein
MIRLRNFLLLIMLFAVGCSRSTTALIADLKSSDSTARVKAVRTLPEKRGDAAQIIPALIEALDDEEDEVRKGAAYGLGTFGAEARSAVPALKRHLKDPDAGVCKAAGVALNYIEPEPEGSSASGE